MRDYEHLIRKLVEDGNESPKVDFKSSADFGKANIAQLARTALAMANTDSEELDNVGYIILGAEPGKIVGGVSELGNDTRRAGLPISLNRYISPEARVEIRAYQDESVGWFGAIVVRRSHTTRPHFIAKEFASNEKDQKSLSIRKNECYVRRGESIALASRDDFERMYQQRFEGQFRSLEEETQRLPSPQLSWLVGDAECEVLKVPPSVLPETGPSQSFPSRAFADGEIAEMTPFDAKTARDFNNSEAEHQIEWEEAADRLAQYKNTLSSLMSLRVRCTNNGDAPLTDAHFFLEFPDGFQVINEEPEKPRFPTRPKRPSIPSVRLKKNIFSDLVRAIETTDERYNLGEVISRLDHSSAFSTTLAIPAESHWGLDAEPPNRAKGWFKKLKHAGLHKDFTRYLLVVPPETCGSFAIQYEVYCDELPEPHKGVLRIRVIEGANQLLPMLVDG